jgi:hypothetical protein
MTNYQLQYPVLLTQAQPAHCGNRKYDAAGGTASNFLGK